MSGHTLSLGGVRTYTQSKKWANEAFSETNNLIRTQEGRENQVWTPWVRKSCVNVCQGCVFKDTVCIVLGSAPPPRGVCLCYMTHAAAAASSASSSSAHYLVSRSIFWQSSPTGELSGASCSWLSSSCCFRKKHFFSTNVFPFLFQIVHLPD